MAKKRIIVIGTLNLTRDQMEQMEEEGYVFDYAPLLVGRIRSRDARRVAIQRAMVNLPHGPLPPYEKLTPRDVIVIGIGSSHEGVRHEIISWIEEEKGYTPGYLRISSNGNITVVRQTEVKPKSHSAPLSL